MGFISVFKGLINATSLFSYIHCSTFINLYESYINPSTSLRFEPL